MECDAAGGVPLWDAYALQLRPEGRGRADLIYGTYLGGSSDDEGLGIALTGGDIVACGWTTSPDFPGTGYAGSLDAYLVRLRPAGAGKADLIYGVLIGGTAGEIAHDVAVSGATSYVVGETTSDDLPTSDGSGLGGRSDAFLARVDGAGSVTYAATVGGSGREAGYGIAVDATGALVVTGYSDSSDLPTTPDAYAPQRAGARDAFVARLDLGNSLPQHIAYATYLGGSADDEGAAVAADDVGRAYVAGYSESADWPIAPDPGAYEPQPQGLEDAFVALLQVSDPSAIRVEKHTNGLDADQAPGVYLYPGQAVTWTYAVANWGYVGLEEVEVVDDVLGPLACPTSTLAPGAVMTCTAHGAAGVGQYVNQATASGRSPGVADAATDTDLSHHYGAVPAIDVTVLTMDRLADQPPGPVLPAGTTVTWTYLITNTGNAPLGAIALVDDALGGVACPYDSLAAAQWMACVATDTVKAGSYAATAVVTGTPPGGLASVSGLGKSHYYGAAPSIALGAWLNGQDASAPPGPIVLAGSTVTWTYRVTNTGNITLTALSVADAGGAALCPSAPLPPHGWATCTATRTAATGAVTGTASASGIPPAGLAPVTATVETHYYGGAPDLALSKWTNGAAASEAPGPVLPAGSAVTWTYRLTNTGNLTLTEVSLLDDREGEVPCAQETLAAGASVTCTLGGEAAPGQYANWATATAQPIGGLAPVTAAARSHYVGYGPNPAITVTKRTEGQDAAQAPGPLLRAGEPVRWSYAVRNAGDAPLTGVTVRDDREGWASCPAGELDVGAAMTCTLEGVAIAGPYSNTATVTATAVGTGALVTASDRSHYYGGAPALALLKWTNGVDVAAPAALEIVVGEAVTWTYRVTNTGNVPLSGLALVDDAEGAIACPQTSLAPGEGMACQAVGVAVPGPYTNRATASGEAPAPLGGVWAEDESGYLGVAGTQYVYLPLVVRRFAR